MRRRRNQRAATAITAVLLTLGLLGNTNPAYADDAPPPTEQNSAAPTSEPSPEPTSEPTPEPTPAPTAEPTPEPTPEPTTGPSSEALSEPAPETAAEPAAETLDQPAPQPASASGTSTYEQDASANSPTTTAVGLPSESCESIGLPSVCATFVDVASVERLAQELTTGCTAPSGACTAAVNAVSGAIRLADTCIAALGLGVSVGELALSGESGVGVPLDCRYVAQTAIDTAGRVMAAVQSCTDGYTKACAAVYEAVDLATDRARGCVNGALDQARVEFSKFAEGTDPGCGNAVYALQGVADGLASLVSSCAAGAGGCEPVYVTAKYVLDGLPGCIGNLVVNITEVQPIVLPSGDSNDPMQCWVTLDQANSLLSSWLGKTSVVPDTLTPMSECSIYLAAPYFATSPVDGTQPRALMPSCNLPESPEPVVVTPSPSSPMLEDGPACRPTREFHPTKVYPWQLSQTGSSSMWNKNVKKATMSVDVETGGKVGVSINAKAEAEAGIIFAKVKSSIETQLSWEHSWSTTYRYTAEVPPRTGVRIRYGSARTVVEGNYVEHTDECVKRVVPLRFRGPFERTSIVEQMPYRT